jgi:hypothetical protein
MKPAQQQQQQHHCSLTTGTKLSVTMQGEAPIGRRQKTAQASRKKKSCHRVGHTTYDLCLTIFLFVIAEVIRTYDNAMTVLAIVDWAV